jgi:hypothetical protein
MRSKFQFFFIIMKLLITVVALVFIGIPLGLIYYAATHSDGMAPAILGCLVFTPFIYLFIKDHKIVTIELTDSYLMFKSRVNGETMVYSYADIERLNIEVHREESFSKSGKITNINFDPRATIYFNDGNEFVMYDDTYSNVYEMVEFIESRRTL